MTKSTTVVDSSKKTLRNQMVIGGGGSLLLLGLIILGLWVSDGSEGRAAIEQSQNRTQGVIKNYTSDYAEQEELWLVESEADIAELKNDKKQLTLMVLKLSKQVENIALEVHKNNQNGPDSSTNSSNAFPSASTSAISVPSNFNSTANVPTPVAAPQRNIVDQMVANSLARQQAIQTPINPASIGTVPVRANTLTVINLDPEQNASVSLGKTVENYLPSGTFVTTTLLSGVDAPTGGQADSNPLPILLRLVDNGQMPNFFRSHVENCHITGAAVGQLSSERAFIRLEMMSCVLKDGTIIERSVKGYVTGEDGKAGLRGNVVTKQGALLARSAAAGFLQGFGSSLNTAGTASSVAGAVNQSSTSVLTSGLAQGTGDAFSGLANYYLERANETHAIIEVSAGRIGEIIFTQGVDFGTSIGSNK